MPFERERDNRTQQQPERQTLQPLILTPDQIRKLSEMTRKDGFLAFDDDEIQMILDLTNPCLLPDFRRFIYRASGLGLNPLHNEIHCEYKFSKNQPKATFVLHIDGLRKIADRSGMRGGFLQKPGIDERGDYVESTVWRKDCQQPFVSRVYTSEFMQTGEYSLYRTKPYHMVAKCGEAFAYKQAFPVSGLNTEDEVEAWPGDQGPRVAQENTGLTVAEKTPEPALAPNPAPAPAPNPAPNPAPEPADAQRKPPASAAAAFGPRVTEPPKPLYQVIADRLKALGVEKSEVTDWTNFYFRYPDRKLTQDDYVEAFGKAEEWIRANSLEQFRAGLKESREQRAEWIRQNGQPGSPAAPAAPATDPDLDRIAAQLSAQVSARFKTWGPELVKLGSLWCVDHVKDAGALEAFLITAGLTDQTPPGRIEALLAISRHMGMSSGIAILEYSAKTNDPLSMIEGQISQAIGKPIRFAMDIPSGYVAKAFADLQAKAANQAAGAVK